MLDRLFLIGPMGAGKTSLGKLVAASLGYQFVDSDRVIEELTGVDIPTIFYYEGEPGFRRREEQVIDHLTRHPRIVLATGGGAILSPFNRKCLAARGCVVYLEVSVEQQLKRTARDSSRPLLQVDDPGKKLRQLARERTPLYEALADIRIDTNQGNIHGIKRKILAEFEQQRSFTGLPSTR